MKIMMMIPEIWSSTDRIFSHFGPFFAFLLPSPYPKNSENQNFEKMEKTPGDIIILSVPEMTIIQYMVTEIGTETENDFCHFGQFFALLPH